MKTYRAIIESPEGDNHRRKYKKDKKIVIDMGSLKKVIPINNGIAPVNYGLILDTYCEADNDEIDILVVSDKEIKIGQEVEVFPIAWLRRKDGDDKIVATDASTREKYREWEDIPKEKRNLIKDFFSCHYEIFAVENSKRTEEYLQNHAR